jgi:hypothetical protein
LRAGPGGVVREVLNRKFAVLLLAVAGLSFVFGYAFVRAAMG